MSEPCRMPTKAMLLAAGKGTRLRPLTETVSKCMVVIAGKPILEHNIERLKSYGVTDIVINLHYRPESITAHFGDGSRWGVRIDYSLETEPLSTMGPLRLVRELPENFLVMNGDILTDLNYRTFRRLCLLHEYLKADDTVAADDTYTRREPAISFVH